MRTMKTQRRMPQHLRLGLGGSTAFASLSLSSVEWRFRDDQRATLRRMVSVREFLVLATAGGGNAASMSEMLPADCRCEARFSDAPSNQSMPSLLAVLPRSRLEASLVARTMRSVRLVKEPLISASRGASTFNKEGRFLSPRNWSDSPEPGCGS